MSDANTVKVLLVGARNDSSFNSIVGPYYPEVTFFRPAVLLKGDAASSLGAEDVIMFDLGDGAMPSPAFAALRRVKDIATNTKIVCVAKAEPNGEIGTYLKDQSIVCETGDYDLTNPCTNKFPSAPRRELVAILRKQSFRRAAAPVCQVPDRRPKELIIEKIRWKTRPVDAITNLNNIILIRPWSVDFLEIIAGGNLHGHDLVRSKMYPGDKRSARDFDNLFKAQLHHTNAALADAKYPLVERVTGIGYEWRMPLNTIVRKSGSTQTSELLPK